MTKIRTFAFPARIPVEFRKWMEDKKKCGISFNSQICSALYQAKKNEDAIVEFIKQENKNPF